VLDESVENTQLYDIHAGFDVLMHIEKKAQNALEG